MLEKLITTCEQAVQDNAPAKKKKQQLVPIYSTTSKNPHA